MALWPGTAGDSGLVDNITNAIDQGANPYSAVLDALRVAWHQAVETATGHWVSDGEGVTYQP